MNRGRNNRADLFRRLWREKPLGTACGIIILLLILVSIFADVLAPYDYTLNKRLTLRGLKRILLSALMESI